MPKQNGRFYFKRSSNGNLTGEYSHNFSKTIETESATAHKKAKNFVGDYSSYWSETDWKKPILLRITIKRNTSNAIYNVTWSDNGKVIFSGEGMLCDDILIGDYRNY